MPKYLWYARSTQIIFILACFGMLLEEEEAFIVDYNLKNANWLSTL
jgi:hypothetical protein